ncbi:MAG: fluoride efflux transporter CrcB [Chloroflexota bacterium]
MPTFVWIGLGGFLGANARYWVQTWSANRWGTDFPLGTFIANVTGAFLLALFATLMADNLNVRPELRLFVATGFLGGYTTFSSLGFETWILLDTKGLSLAVLNLFGNIVVGALSIFLGIFIAKLITSS